MNVEIESWLHDILQAISEIDGYFVDMPKDFFVYQANLKTKRAVERNIEIIGEAVRRILKADESVNLPNSRKIIDTRNRITHAYDSVSDEIIWGIVIRHLPELKMEIERMKRSIDLE